MLFPRQHTLLWDKGRCFDNFGPGQKFTLMNIIYDRYTEELSFPAIYYNVRTFNTDVSVTLYTTATSEIRRRDLRGITPRTYFTWRLLYSPSNGDPLLPEELRLIESRFITDE